jgi:hypothetical protein
LVGPRIVQRYFIRRSRLSPQAAPPDTARTGPFKSIAARLLAQLVQQADAGDWGNT